LVTGSENAQRRTFPNSSNLVGFLIWDLDRKLLYIFIEKSHHQPVSSSQGGRGSAPSIAITTSTASRESRPSSEVNEAVGVTFFGQNRGEAQIIVSPVSSLTHKAPAHLCRIDLLERLKHIRDTSLDVVLRK
jgi:hypothetical protein